MFFTSGSANPFIIEPSSISISAFTKLSMGSQCIILADNLESTSVEINSLFLKLNKLPHESKWVIIVYDAREDKVWFDKVSSGHARDGLTAQLVINK